MTEYYKALRPNGTDFATGTTRPRKGRWMPRIEGELIMCEWGYHVSDAVGETLIGGSWPCKLARVEIPKGEWQREGHKLVVPTYRVVEWLPAWQALGPNGEAVAAMIERAGKLTADEVQRLDAAMKTAGRAAWRRAMDITRVAAWAAASGAARGAAGGAAEEAAWWASRWWASRAAEMEGARDAARRAAWALVVRDLLTTKQFDILYGPWASVVGSAT